MRYFVYKDSEVLGPFTPDDLERSVPLRPDTLVCEESVSGRRDSDWRLLGEVAELSGAVLVAPPMPAEEPLSAASAGLLERLELDSIGVPSESDAEASRDWLDELFEDGDLKRRWFGAEEPLQGDELTTAKGVIDELSMRVAELQARIRELEQRAPGAPAAPAAGPAAAAPSAADEAAAPDDAGVRLGIARREDAKPELKFGAPKPLRIVRKDNAASAPAPAAVPPAPLAELPGLPAEPPPAPAPALPPPVLPPAPRRDEPAFPAAKLAEPPAPAPEPAGPALGLPSAPAAPPAPAPSPFEALQPATLLAAPGAPLPGLGTPPAPPVADLAAPAPTLSAPPAPTLSAPPPAEVVSTPTLSAPPVPSFGGPATGLFAAPAGLPAAPPPPTSPPAMPPPTGPTPTQANASQTPATQDVLARLARPAEPKTEAPKLRPQRSPKLVLAAGAILFMIVGSIFAYFLHNSRDLKTMASMGADQKPLGTEIPDDKANPFSRPAKPAGQPLAAPQAAPSAAPGTQPSVAQQAQLPSAQPQPAPAAVQPDNSGAAGADQGDAAVSLVKNYPLDGNRGSVGQWLQYSFTANPGDGNKEQWTAGAVDATTYLVQYQVVPGAKSSVKEAISYVFEADVSRRTVLGKNPAARQLLSGTAPIAKAPKAASKPKPRRKRVHASVSSKPKELPLLPLPSDSELLPPAEDDSSFRNDTVQPGL